MANLKLEHIYKVYPNGTKAVNDFSLDIKNGEFIVFVGPSGCGKSTTLRMIAGLEDITAGELYIDSTIVNDMEPKDRDIAMVFQNYALYPHMTVYENMAFGLRLRHIPDDVIQEKVLWAADILGIKDYLDRKPRNMSGGQRQRVSLGRAILRDPKVMLLDEPLSNLDAKLRASMRTEIAKLHQRLKTTFIYVTHDQTEAMTLGDRVVVMRNGRIQQVDTPKNLYNFPGNKFVAGFIGTPQMNFFDCTLKKKDDKVLLHLDINNTDIALDYNYLLKVLPQYLDGKHPLVLGVRCEHVLLTDENNENSIKVKISHFEELGSECLIYGFIGKEEVTSDKGQIIIRVKDVEGLKVGQEIYVTLKMNHIYFFDKQTENTIMPRIPVYNSFVADVVNNQLSFLGQSIALPNALKQDKDYHGCELRVPVDAFKICSCESCAFKADVVEVEVIGDVKLVHLKYNDRVFFAKASLDFDVTVGSTVSITLDFTRLSLLSDNEPVFHPIVERDSFIGSFLNYETVMSTKPCQEYQDYRDKKIAAVASAVDAEIETLNKEHESKVHELSSANVAENYEKAALEFGEFNQKAQAEIATIRSETKQTLATLQKEFAEKKKEEKKKNDELFANKKAKEISDFASFKANNKDPYSLKRRKDEYHIFMDNFKTEKDNTLNLILNGITMEHESQISSIKASARRRVDLMKKETAERKRQLSVLKNPLANLNKEYKKALADLQKKKAREIKRAGFIFFFELSGNYLTLSPDIISNKLIQGLGTRVFTKDFRIEMPHDAYEVISEGTDSFKVTVKENLDYGNVYYILTTFTDNNGNEQKIYLKSDKPLTIGTTLALKFDIEKSQITETDMNIRLY